MANTGSDPTGAWTEFIKKDCFINIDVYRDTFKREDDLNARKHFPAVGCTKKLKHFQETN